MWTPLGATRPRRREGRLRQQLLFLFEIESLEIEILRLVSLDGGAQPREAMAVIGSGALQSTQLGEQLAEARTRLKISRAQRRADGVEVRVVGGQPSADAVRVAPDLEDAYLWLLHRSGEASA